MGVGGTTKQKLNSQQRQLTHLCRPFWRVNKKMNCVSPSFPLFSTCYLFTFFSVLFSRHLPSFLPRNKKDQMFSSFAVFVVKDDDMPLDRNQILPSHHHHLSSSTTKTKERWGTRNNQNESTFQNFFPSFCFVVWLDKEIRDGPPRRALKNNRRLAQGGEQQFPTEKEEESLKNGNLIYYYYLLLFVLFFFSLFGFRWRELFRSRSIGIGNFIMNDRRRGRRFGFGRNRSLFGIGR